MEKERRKKEKRERLLQDSKHIFDDQEYLKQKEQVIEDMEAALQAGMEKARRRAERAKQHNAENVGASSKLSAIDSW